MAVQDRDTFKASVDSTITTNSNKEISGADVNTALDNLADSVVFLNESAGAKSPVRVATTAAGTLASSFENGDTVDGITLATGDRILIKDQATASQNGVYTVNASGAPTRATDYDTSDEVILGSLFYVSEGTTNGGKFFYLSAPTGTITLGSSNLTFTEQSSTFNVGGLSAETTFDPDNDSLSFYDNSAAATKRITGANLGTQFKKLRPSGEFYTDSEDDDGNSSTADTIDWSTGNFHKSTMTGNCTYTFTAPSGPTTLLLKLVQDATGSRTATWPATVKWQSGTAPTLSTAASAVDIISFYYDGTNYYGSAGLNFS